MQLSREGFTRIANIFDDAGQVFLSGLVVAPIFINLEPYRLSAIMTIGLIFAFICWIVSLGLTKRSIEL